MTKKTGIIPRTPPLPKQTLSHKDEAEIIMTLKVLVDIVAEAGEDTVYQPKPHLGHGTHCVYVHNGAADCLVGRVLHRLGMSLADLTQWEGQACYDMITAPALMSRPEPPVGVLALKILAAAQEKQDMGHTWGDARDAALYEAYVEYGVKIHA